MSKPIFNWLLKRDGFSLGVKVGDDILHRYGAADAEDDGLVVVIDGHEEGRLGHVDVERGVYDLVVAAAASLPQRRQMASAARVADHLRLALSVRLAGAAAAPKRAAPIKYKYI